MVSISRFGVLSKVVSSLRKPKAYCLQHSYGLDFSNSSSNSDLWAKDDVFDNSAARTTYRCFHDVYTSKSLPIPYLAQSAVRPAVATIIHSQLSLDTYLCGFDVKRSTFDVDSYLARL